MQQLAVECEEFAFGELLLRPWEYYEYTFTEFQRAIKGYQSKELKFAKLMRRVAFVAKDFKDKKDTEEKLWPLEEAKEKKPQGYYKKLHEAYKKAGAIK